MKINQLYYGDNLEILRKYIPTETVDLCYIDPPFNSQHDYHQIYSNIGQEDKAQAQAFVDTWTWDDRAIMGFETITSNADGLSTKQSIELIIGLSKVLGKGSLLAYLVSMTQRIAEIHRVLKPTGSFYLHCDPTASHYLKLVLDAVFCIQGGQFQNELIWAYSGGGRPQDGFARKHDVIFRYSKSDNFTFNADAIRVPYNLDTEKYTSPKAWGSHKGSSKSYAPNELGKIPEDWWVISTINSQSKERLGYPTQKPEALLERIIKASSNEGDIILDAYCGCGTTVAVAQRLNRHWIGIDITYQSVSLILRRLEQTFGAEILETITISGVPKDMAAARALAHKKDDRLRKEFEKWAVLTYSNHRAVINEKKGADKGIDGIAYIQDSMTDYKQVIFSVKSGQNLGVGMVRDLGHVVTREEAAMGILITLEEPTKPMRQEAKQAGSYQNQLTGQPFDRLQLVTIQEILQGAKLSLPLTHEVLKKAKGQSNIAQEAFI